ncbi:hypothetical protein NRIC_16960 [Enterococcus florum]|uniref:Sensor histidine kinase NatK-like C-terminal domain-containing protein n=2 Tax=Enterococcus florum TaxID=2480627 RepID=A0A4P5P766_9ENTE|nr:hypothetical protein NRIC_16960 [Enterococcus florum]
MKIVQYSFQEVLTIHNNFSIVCQFAVMLILYVVFNRGDRLFLTNLLTVTCFAFLAVSSFEYLRMFLLSTKAPIFSIGIINWYLLLWLAFLPLLRRFLNWLRTHILAAPTTMLVLMWTLWIAIDLFVFFVQIYAVTEPTKYPGYSSVIFLSESFIGRSMIQSLIPSAFFIIEPLYQTYTVNMILIVQNALAAGAFIFLLFLNRRSKLQLAHQEQMQYELTQYVKNLEKMTQDIRKNHHDFSNILFSLGGYIYQPTIDQKELKSYFESVTQTFEADYDYFLETSKLGNLEIPELKTLIFTKLVDAKKQNISFTIEIDTKISSLGISGVNLSRIFGILLDNALEAAAESEVPQVCLAFINEPASYVCMIVNSTKHKNIHSLLTQDSFSTKGESRGLGLSIVRKIVQSYSGILTMRTSQKHDQVFQTLIFAKPNNSDTPNA